MTTINSTNISAFAEENVRVFLDGTELDGNLVFEASEEFFYVRIAIPGKDGLIFVDPRTDEVRAVYLYGQVDITLHGRDLSAEQSHRVMKLFHREHKRAA